ncbi:MAG: hypothetical protein ABEI86_13930 [Halobacteriaceae archaeon]
MSQSELREKCERNHRIWYNSYPEDEIVIDHDSNLPRELRMYPTKFEPDRRFICEIKEGLIIGQNAIGLSTNGRLLQETFSMNTPMDQSIKSKTRLISDIFGIQSNENVFKYDYVFPLVSEYDNYYHWVVEYLPKLRMLDNYEEKT